MIGWQTIAYFFIRGYLNEEKEFTLYAILSPVWEFVFSEVS
ncbi:hypothetical protein [Proteus vulgaris]|nr:hypothetical protein [Proteus vulgaris]WIF70951.1 hypothetical protein QN092_13330 [Proteus vulgaris]CRL60860.1 hypothetical protein BN1805_00950 [Proteus vulgaris]SUC01811.1 Uncharacterised protein [Proteus vulgaris]